MTHHVQQTDQFQDLSDRVSNLEVKVHDEILPKLDRIIAAVQSKPQRGYRTLLTVIIAVIAGGIVVAGMYIIR